MSLMELHIIKFLIPCKNLQLWPMLPFNLSVIRKTDCTPQIFHGETCFPVFKFLFWFLFALFPESEHPAWTQSSCTNHPSTKKPIKVRFHLLNLIWESPSFVIQLTIPHKPQLIFRAAEVLYPVSNGFYYLFQAELLYGMAGPFLFPFVGKRKATVLCQSERSHVLK